MKIKTTFKSSYNQHQVAPFPMNLDEQILENQIRSKFEVNEDKGDDFYE